MIFRNPGMVRRAQIDARGETLKVYADVRCREFTGLGIVTRREEGNIVRESYYLEYKVDMAMLKSRNLQKHIIVHTDNKHLTNNFVKRKVKINVEAEIWGVIEQRE